MWNDAGSARRKAEASGSIPRFHSGRKTHCQWSRSQCFRHLPPETNLIDIGNSMKNLTHSIALGTAEASRPIVVAIVYTLVFGLALGVATYFLLTFPKR